jgi:hypothetical protein
VIEGVSDDIVADPVLSSGAVNFHITQYCNT